jgi:hypothetical protein
MANLISHGFVFWYPTQSLAGGNAGVVNDPNRTWFRDQAIPPASSVEYFWHISASLPGLDTNDVPLALIHDLGLTYFTGSQPPTADTDQQKTNAGINYAENGGLELQAALNSSQLYGEDLTGPTIFPSFFGPTPDFSYDFSLGGGILIVTGSFNVLGAGKGIRDLRWYWTAQDDTPSEFQQIVYNTPEDQAQFIADKFVFNPTDKNNILTGQPEVQLTKAVAYVGGIFLTASEYGIGNYVLDIPAYMKEGGGAGLDIYKLGPT